MSPRPSVCPNELFLSHPHQVSEFSDRLVSVLRGHGVPVWFSTQNIGGGQEWMAQIHQALTRCNWFAVVLCAHSLNSIWLKRELQYVLMKPRFEGKIIPLLLENNPEDYEPIAFSIAQFQHIDFRSDFDAGCRDLLRIWGLGYHESSGV
jgi:hypothetical protein